MKYNKSRYFNKTIFTILCGIALNFEGVCCSKALNLDDDNKITQVMSLGFNVGSAVLGSVSSWETLNGESSTGVKIANASTSLAAALFKGCTTYWDWKNGKLKGAAHMALNGLIIGCNIASAAFSIESVSTDDQNEANIYNFASSLTNVLGLGLKAVDLYITTSPYDSKKLRKFAERY